MVKNILVRLNVLLHIVKKNSWKCPDKLFPKKSGRQSGKPPPGSTSAAIDHKPPRLVCVRQLQTKAHLQSHADDVEVMMDVFYVHVGNSPVVENIKELCD